MSRERIHPNVVLHDASPNRYHPRGARPSLIVIHDTESHNRPGVSDLRSIGELFANPSFDASAHVCTDADGQSARFVDDGDAAWSCVSYNRPSLNVEQIGFATGGEYTSHEIHETARWVARWSRRHGIPIRRGRTAFGRVLRSGVVSHSSLGAAGGGHSDPGRYPMKRLLELAKHYRHRLDALT
jgi:hypothetical protein